MRQKRIWCGKSGLHVRPRVVMVFKNEVDHANIHQLNADDLNSQNQNNATRVHHVVTGPSGVRGVVAQFHVVLVLKRAFESVLMVYPAQVVVLEIMKIPLVATLKHVQHGPTGSHGQCARQHVAVDSNDALDIAAMEQHVLGLLPKNAFVKKIRVRAGQIGPLGQTVVVAVEVVPNG